MLQASVVICTHNPRHDFMERVLDSLREQTLPFESWELLLVDNRSEAPLATRYDLSWHPHGRHVREEELGLNAANLRGIQEAAADLLVFVHDDNVLKRDYLQAALDILGRMPWLGAFHGSTIGEYEVPFPEWAPMMPLELAVREVKRAAWGCLPGTQSLPFAPVGAGMIIRKNIAEHYAQKVATDAVRQALGRKGEALSSGEDSDMAFCACELGYAVGVFPELSLVHIIPKGRLERSYLLKLAEGIEFSKTILRYSWDKELPQLHKPGRPCRSVRWFNAYSRWRGKFRPKVAKTFAEECWEVKQRGIDKARELILSLETGKSGGTLQGPDAAD